MKSGTPPKRQEIVDLVEKEKGNFDWAKFADEWDVYVTKSSIKVVRNIKDINKVTEICSYKYIAAKKNFEMDAMSDEEEAIVSMIEAQFLDGLMTWRNYREAWGVRWDDERKRIETYLMNMPQTQIEVTPEMIQKVLDRGTAESNVLFDSVQISINDNQTKEE
jgi:rubrerythrin